MKIYKRFIVGLIVVLIGLGAYYGYTSFIEQKTEYKTPEESDIYVRFDMEVYDKIREIYWADTTDEQLSDLFKNSLDKITGTANDLISKDRSGTAKMISSAYSQATSTEAKKTTSLDLAMVVLYNLLPIGRNGILSDEQETAFRQNVSNMDPSKNLYLDLGLEKGANIEEINLAYNKKADELKKSTSAEAKEELEKITYSHFVLSDRDSKDLYDQAQIEPTLFSKIVGQTLYVDLSKISPTTLIEFVRAVDNASTTKNIDTMIIDFRNNVGGSLDFLVNFFGLFVGKNQYVFDFFQKGDYLPQRSVQPKYPELERFKEIAILTDSMTQSTAELTTATFKKFRLARVVGTVTRGWGTVENTYPLETEINPGVKYSLLLVNSLTLRDDGEPIEGNGIIPDIDITKSGWQNELTEYFKSKSLIEAIKKEIVIE